MNKNNRMLLWLVAGVVAMVGLSYISVPLYKIFCSVTGFGGTIQRTAIAPTKISDQTVTVRFDSNVSPALPWDFAPEKRQIVVKLGQMMEVNYHAYNRSDKSITAVASMNVQPNKAGAYFNKINCFCFEKQTLKAHERAVLPVRFFVDPAIAKEKDIKNITLSYTFFISKN